MSTKVLKMIQVETGRGRPRHQRFVQAYANLCRDMGLLYEHRSATQCSRALMQVTTQLRGFRAVQINTQKHITLVHQALNVGSTPYIAEFDVPLAIHGYSFTRYLKKQAHVERQLSSPHLRVLLTFSDWARRSFGLHFGENIESKCRTLYPLTVKRDQAPLQEKRKYDFVFISTSFRIKAGPQAVRAFGKARKFFPTARMCVVTQLGQASKALGDLSQYGGVDWREANLQEEAIANLLEQSRCLVHPSLSDSFGVVVAEALAAGCAIIATDIASFPELVGEDNGWLLRAPQASVVGDTFIPEYGNVAHHDKYLRRLSLHELEHGLVNHMLDLLANNEQATARMAASRARFDKLCSLGAWRQRMGNILRDAFPELLLLPPK